MSSTTTTAAAAARPSATAKPTGVVFDFNLITSQPGGQENLVVHIIGSVLHTVAIFFLIVALTLSIRGFLSSKSRFWLASIIGVLLLIPVPFCEWYYFLAFYSNKTLWDFSEMLTLTGDVCTRFGYAIITTCRFYRLRIVWDKGNSNKGVNHLGVRKTGANASNRSLVDWLGIPRNTYRVATIVLWVLLVASTGAVTFLRIVEYIHRETRAKRIPVPIVDDARQIERTISGVAFSFAFFGNVAADYLFYLVVVRGIKGDVTSRDKFKALLPYMPVMIFQAMYLLLLVLAAIFTDRQYRYLIASYIILVLFLPTFEAFIFYMVSIPQTRSMVAKSRGGGSGYGSGYGSGSGGRSRSRSNGPAAISKASATSPLDYYTSAAAEESNIPLPPPKPTTSSNGTSTAMANSGHFHSSNDSLSVQSPQRAYQPHQQARPHRAASPGPNPMSPTGPTHSSSHPAWAGYPQPPKSPNPPSYRSHPSVDSSGVPRWQPSATPTRQNSSETPMTQVHQQHHQYQHQALSRQGSFKHPSTVNNIGAPVRSSPPSSLQLAGQARVPSQQQQSYPTSPVEGEEPQWRSPRW